MGLFQCKSQQLLIGKCILICFDEKGTESPSPRKKNIASNLVALKLT